VFHESDTYGSKSDNGSWNGMIGMVSNGIVHVAAEVFAVTKERSEVVAFTKIVKNLR